MNFASILSLVLQSIEALFTVAKTSPALTSVISHNQGTISSATNVLAQAGAIAPEAAAAVNVAASTLAAFDPKAANTAAEVESATNTVAGAIASLSSALTTPATKSTATTAAS